MKCAWFTYLSLLVLAGAARLVQKVMADSGGFASRYTPLLIAAVLVVGVLGHIYQKPLGRAWFWQLLFWLSVTVSTSAIAFSFYLALIAGPFDLVFILMLFTLALIRAQWRVWQYFRSKSIWRHQHITTHPEADH